MIISRSLLLVSLPLLFGPAFAQNPCDGGMIATQADAVALQSCDQISGLLTIDNTFAGALSIPSITSIRYSLIATNCPYLTRIDAPLLSNVSALYLSNLANLTQVNVPALVSVRTVHLITLPRIAAFNTPSALLTVDRTSTDWTIMDTSLTTFTDVVTRNSSIFTISGNLNLTSINFNRLEAIGELRVFENGQNASLNLPQLYQALGDVTFRDLGAITIPRLERSLGSIKAVNNNIKDLQLGNLTRTTNDLIVENNPFLTRLNLSRLYSLGGYTSRNGYTNGDLSINNNTMLRGFKLPYLFINGDITLVGPWTQRDLDLRYSGYSRGSIFINSTLPANDTSRFNCTEALASVQRNRWTIATSVRSTFQCNGVYAQNTPSPSSTSTSTSTDSMSSSSRVSPIPIVFGIGIGAALIAFVLTMWCIISRRRQKRLRQTMASRVPPTNGSTMDPPRPGESSSAFVSRIARTQAQRQQDLEMGQVRGTLTTERAAATAAAARREESGMEQTAPSGGAVDDSEPLPKYEAKADASSGPRLSAETAVNNEIASESEASSAGGPPAMAEIPAGAPPRYVP